MVHPNIIRGHLVDLLAEIAVSTGHRHHSSMSKFPSKLHNGKQPITYGWLVSIGGLADVNAVVEGLLEIKPATS
ncbi:hypothetical protein D9M71_747740 [compost metagenome]